MAQDEVVIMEFLQPNKLIVTFLMNLQDPKQEDLSRRMNVEYYRHADACHEEIYQHNEVPCPMNRKEGEIVAVYDPQYGILRGYIMGMDTKDTNRHAVFLPENGEIRSYHPGDIHPLKNYNIQTAPRARILIVERAPAEFGNSSSISSLMELRNWSEKQDCKLLCKRTGQLNNFVWKGDIVRVGKDRGRAKDFYSDLFAHDERNPSNKTDNERSQKGDRVSPKKDPLLSLFDKRDDDGKKYRQFLDKKLRPNGKRSQENKLCGTSSNSKQEVRTNSSSNQVCDFKLNSILRESNLSVNSFIRPEYRNLKVSKSCVEDNPFTRHAGSSRNLQQIPIASSIVMEPRLEDGLVAVLDKPELKGHLSPLKVKNPFAMCKIFYEEEQWLQRLKLETFAYGNDVQAPYISATEIPFLKQHEKALKENFAKQSSSIMQYAIPNLLKKRSAFVIDPSDDRSMSYLIPLVAELKETHKQGMKHLDKPLALIIVDSIATCDAVYAKLVGMLEIAFLRYMNVKILTNVEEDLEKELQEAKFLELLIVLDDVLYNLMDRSLFKYYLCKTTKIIFDNADAMITLQRERLLQAFSGIWIEIKSSMAYREFPEPQVIVQSTKWSPFFKLMEVDMEDPVFVMPPVDSVAFGNMVFEVRFVDHADTVEEFHLRTVALVKLIDDETVLQNVIIVCCSINDATKLLQSLQCQITNFDVALVKQASEQFQTLSRITICTDETVSKLRVTSDATLVHFGMPNTQSLFWMRHCVLWPTLSRDKDSTIVYAVLASSESPLVHKAEKLKSLGAKLPVAMEEFLQKEMLAKQSSKDMCAGILWHGFCNENKCSSRHRFILEELHQQPVVPNEGEITVRIVEVNNASSYVAQLVLRKEWIGGKLCVVQNYDEELSELSRRLQELYAVANNRVALEFLDSGSYVAIERDGKYERAKINKYFKKSKNVLLDCIDSGVQVTRKVSDSALLKLPENFRDRASHAIELIVCNLKPILASRKEPATKRDIPAEISAHTRNRLFNGRVLGCIGRRVWVDRVQVKTTAASGTQCRLHRMLLSTKLAEESSDHLQTLRKLCMEAGMNPESVLFKDIDNSAMRDSEYCQPGEFVQWAHLVMTGAANQTIICTNIINPDNIHCFNDSYTDQFSRMRASLNECMENFSSSFLAKYAQRGYFTKGNLVAFHAAGSDGWTRGIIVSEASDEEHSRIYEVFDADTGISYCDVKLKELFPLPKRIAHVLPFQAITIKIANILPVDPPEWNDEARKFMKAELLPENKEQILNVKVLGKMECGVIYGNGYEVLVSKNETSELDLGEQMVKQGLAVLNSRFNVLRSLNDRSDVSTVSAQIEGSSVESPLPFTIDEIVAMEFLAMSAKRAENRPYIPTATTGTDSSGLRKENCVQPVLGLQRCAIEWFQTDTDVFIRALIPDVKEWKHPPTIGKDKKTLEFETRHPPGYGMRLQLYKKVESEVQTVLLGQYVKIKLVKRLSGLPWRNLTLGDLSDSNLRISCNQDLSEDDCTQSTRVFPFSSGSGDESECSESIFEVGQEFDDCDWH